MRFLDNKCDMVEEGYLDVPQMRVEHRARRQGVDGLTRAQIDQECSAGEIRRWRQLHWAVHRDIPS
jgi:hypothetical protein